MQDFVYPALKGVEGLRADMLDVVVLFLKGNVGDDIDPVSYTHLGRRRHMSVRAAFEKTT